jgi:hypothetical protein
MNGERASERERVRAAEIRGVIAFLIAKGKKVNFHFYLSLTLASLNRKKVGKIIRGIFFLRLLQVQGRGAKLLIASRVNFPFPLLAREKKRRRRKK